MYTFECEYTPYIEANPDGTYKENPWLVIEDRQDSSGWSGSWSFATFHYNISESFLNGTLSLGLNKVPTFTLKIYKDGIVNKDGSPKEPINPNYLPQTPIVIDKEFHWGNIDPYRTSCTLKRDGKIIFEGRFASVEECMDSDGRIYKTVICEGQLAYLSDVVVDSAEIKTRFDELGYKEYTAKNLAYAIVRAYNQATGGYAGNMNKTFGIYNASMGSLVFDDNQVSVSGFSGTYEYTLDSNSPDTPLNWLKRIFVDELGGYISITQNTDKTKTEAGYLKLVITRNCPTHVSTQKINVGSNMKSLTVRSAYADNGGITQYVPYGGIGADGKRLKLEHVAQPIYGGTGNIVQREVTNGSLLNSYGSRQAALIYDDLTDDGQKSEDEIIALESAMLQRARTQADNLNSTLTSVEVSAFDLYYAGYNTEEFAIGSTYTIENELLSFSADLLLVEMNLDLGEPWKGKLTFGSGLRKMSGQTAGRLSMLEKRVHNAERLIGRRLDHTAIQCHDPDDPGAILTAEVFAQMLANRGD